MYIGQFELGHAGILCQLSMYEYREHIRIYSN